MKQPAPRPKVRDFLFQGTDAAQDIRDRYGYDGDLVEIFTGVQGAMVHKWHHYLPIYDRYFGPWRGKPLKFLEIGVSFGGSLQMWRNYFGPDAVIFGIDINPDCAAYDGHHGRVRIGSQDDPAFLREVVAEMGGVDVVLDDGSHHMPHIRASLEVLFPLLSSPGTYMIEDLHTAYWPNFGGGLGAPGNFFDDVRRMIDEMHCWYHSNPADTSGMGASMSGISVHDSIAVLEKWRVERPVNSRFGTNIRPE